MSYGRCPGGDSSIPVLSRKENINYRPSLVCCLSASRLPSFPPREGRGPRYKCLEKQAQYFCFSVWKTTLKAVKKPKFSLRVLYKRAPWAAREKNFSSNCCPANRQTDPKTTFASPTPQAQLVRIIAAGKKWGKTERGKKIRHHKLSRTKRYAASRN